ANNTNGTAKAQEKPNIPIAGPKRSPRVAASTSNVPMIGPVQENDTTAKLADIKNNPTNPLLSELASILLTNELGRVISKAPKKDAANTSNIKKKKKLKIPIVESSFNASGTKAMVINIPNATQMTIIIKPYMKAWETAFDREPAFLVKKPTVNGTIGKIQGIKNAAKPPNNPAINIPHKEASSYLGSELYTLKSSVLLCKESCVIVS